MAILKSRPISQFPSIEKIRDEAVKSFGQDMADLMLQTFRNIYDDLFNLSVEIVDTLPTGLTKESRTKLYLLRGTGTGADKLYILIDTGSGGYGFKNLALT
jgi:predicted outer membrane protein